MNYLNMNDDKLMPVVTDLNVLLADYHLYYQKLRNFHWNVSGKHFFDLHEKFEEMYQDARLKIDEIAERILTLKYHPISNMSDYLEMSEIKEVRSLKTDIEMVNTLLEDHTILLAQMKKIIKKANTAGDEGTIDLLGAYVRELEKSSWMLNAWSSHSVATLSTSEVTA